MAEKNLGRVVGSMWYTGTGTDNASIASDLSTRGITPKDGDLYLTGQSQVWKYVSASSAWVLYMTLSGINVDQGGSLTINSQPQYVGTSQQILALTSDNGIAVSTDTGNWFYWNGSSYVDSGIKYQNTAPANAFLQSGGGVSWNQTPQAPLDDANTFLPNTIVNVDHEIANLPDSDHSGTMVTLNPYSGPTTGTGALQIWIKRYNNEMFFRIKWGSGEGTWESWRGISQTSSQNVDLSQTVQAGGQIQFDWQASGFTDLNNFPANKFYTWSFSNEGIANWPSGCGSDALIFTYYPGGSAAFQMMIDKNTGYIYTRVMWGNSWTSWANNSASSSSSGIMATPSLFNSIAAVGDSYTQGSYVLPSGTWKNLNEGSTWIAQIGKMYGIDWYNYGVGGASTRSYLTNGLPSVLSGPACDFYFLALGINDGYSLGASYLGTIDDIKSNWQDNADTFYGNYGKIISQIQQHSPNAKMAMVLNMSFDAPDNDEFDTAIKNIASHFGIPVIDPWTDPFFNSPAYTNNYGGHPTPLGYSGMGLAFSRLLSSCMENNINYFKYGAYPTNE